VLPYVGLEHIERESGHFAPEFKRQPETLLATKFRFTDKHVLYGKLRPYLKKVVLPSFEGVCTTEILPILPKEGKLDRKYLYAVLLSNEFVKWASARVSGANLPRLDPKLLNDYPIPLPPLEQQNRISEILDVADKFRRQRRYAQELSGDFLQSVFVRFFGDLLKEDRWKFDYLSSVAEVVSGVAKGQKYNGQETVMVPYLRVANVQDGYLNLSEIKYIEALPSDVEFLRLQEGDVLMTEGGDFDKLGRGAIWHNQVENCIHQNHIFRVRLDRKQALPRFFSAYLLTPFVKAYFLKCAKQTTNLASINMSQLKALPVPLPSLELQEQFIKVVDKFEQLQSQQREATRQAEHFFETLLHRAFRGEL
jgi:type I restriction enzyme, S subunit